MPPAPHVVVFEPGSDAAGPPLVLLHGSFGTETDLLPLAQRIAPGRSRLGVRGTVALNHGYAFFRRHPDRRVDEPDLTSRLPLVREVLHDLGDQSRLTRPPVVVGFSNGAVMAAALVATCPELLAGAVLFRPLPPFATDDSYAPGTVPTLIIDGAQDARRSASDGPRLADQLHRAGSTVTHRVLSAGHAITTDDEAIARDWLGSLSSQ